MNALTSNDGCLEVTRRVYHEVLMHALREAPNECCGILAGRGRRAEAVFALRNALESPRQFEGNAKDMLAAFRAIDREQLTMLAIYHSHPTSPAAPSRTDLRNNLYGTMPQMIVSLAQSPPVVEVFEYTETAYRTVPWRVVGE